MCSESSKSAPPGLTDHVYNIFENTNWVVGVTKHMHDGMLCRRLLKRWGEGMRITERMKNGMLYRHLELGSDQQTHCEIRKLSLSLSLSLLISLCLSLSFSIYVL